jgi:hypothetical protein
MSKATFTTHSRTKLHPSYTETVKTANRWKPSSTQTETMAEILTKLMSLGTVAEGTTPIETTEMEDEDVCYQTTVQMNTEVANTTLVTTGEGMIITLDEPLSPQESWDPVSQGFRKVS